MTRDEAKRRVEEWFADIGPGGVRVSFYNSVFSNYMRIELDVPEVGAVCLGLEIPRYHYPHVVRSSGLPGMTRYPAPGGPSLGTVADLLRYSVLLYERAARLEGELWSVFESTLAGEAGP